MARAYPIPLAAPRCANTTSLRYTPRAPLPRHRRSNAHIWRWQRGAATGMTPAHVTFHHYTYHHATWYYGALLPTATPPTTLPPHLFPLYTLFVPSTHTTYTQPLCTRTPHTRYHLYRAHAHAHTLQHASPRTAGFAGLAYALCAGLSFDW